MHLTLIFPLPCLHRPRGPVHSVHVSRGAGTQTLCVDVLVRGVTLQFGLYVHVFNF